MRRSHLLLAAVLFASPQPGLAEADPASGALAAVSADRDDEDDGNPRLGLLGLWGLAGLLGLLRREPNIHVEARRREDD